MKIFTLKNLSKPCLKSTETVAVLPEKHPQFCVIINHSSPKHASIMKHIFPTQHQVYTAKTIPGAIIGVDIMGG